MGDPLDQLNDDEFARATRYRGRTPRSVLDQILGVPSDRIIFDGAGGIQYSATGDFSPADRARMARVHRLDNDTQEVPPMPDNTVALRGQIQTLIEKLANAQALEDRFPAQPPDLSVLRWVETFGRGQAQREYTYVALRAGDQWYITGRDGGETLTWEQLRVKIGSKSCYVATGWNEIPQPVVHAAEEATDPQTWWELVYGKGKNTINGDVAGANATRAAEQ
jgi:hypothetical protein